MSRSALCLSAVLLLTLTGISAAQERDRASFPVTTGADRATSQTSPRAERTAGPVLRDTGAPPFAGFVADRPPPPDLETLLDTDEGTALERPEGLEIRRDALREAALSFGARGGLAARTYEINRSLLSRAAELDRIFDFRALLITAPSGLMIEPPVIGEAENALIIAEDGQQAAVTERIISINRQVRIVSAPRDWRFYLERDWGAVDPPPALLLPQDGSERRQWRQWVRQGWELGMQQADEIFEINLNRLNADFLGMVRYRKLLAQGIVSSPFPLFSDRGITGGGDELRIGERSVAITGQPQLNPEAGRWRPADR